MKKILLVEDEVHKQQELVAQLEKFFQGEEEIHRVEGVHAAFWAVSSSKFDLVLLDMALPTFSAEDSAVLRGHDQALGGIEVLRTLKSVAAKPKVIIITQYPQITVGGKQLDLAKAAQALAVRYEQDIIGAVIYKYGSTSYVSKLATLLKRVV